MGQRSQIYLKYPIGDKGRYGLIANYYQWNFGERMISRAASAIRYLEYIKNNFPDSYFCFENYVEKMRRYLDVNFDMEDICISQDIVKEWADFDFGDFADYVFRKQDNNDGCLFLELVNNGEGQWEIHYCFTTCDHKILDAHQYMEWESTMMVDNWRNLLPSDAVKICDDNMKFIMSNAKLMTNDELENMMEFPYENIPKPF